MHINVNCACQPCLLKQGDRFGYTRWKCSDSGGYSCGYGRSSKSNRLILALPRNSCTTGSVGVVANSKAEVGVLT